MSFVLVTALYAAIGTPLVVQAMDNAASCEVVAAAQRRLPQVAWARCVVVVKP